MYIKSSKHGIAMLLFGRFLHLLNLSDAYIVSIPNTPYVNAKKA